MSIQEMRQFTVPAAPLIHSIAELLPYFQAIQQIRSKVDDVSGKVNYKSGYSMVGQHSTCTSTELRVAFIWRLQHCLVNIS